MITLSSALPPLISIFRPHFRATLRPPRLPFIPQFADFNKWALADLIFCITLLSFNDHLGLTFDGYQAIPCAMNARQNMAKSNIGTDAGETAGAGGRSKRIRKISQVLKWVLLLYLLSIGCSLVRGYYPPVLQRTNPDNYWHVSMFGTYTTFAGIPFLAKLYIGVAVAVFFAAAFICYQLLDRYEKGVIFSPGNTRLLNRIGALALAYGLASIWFPVLYIWWRDYLGVHFGPSPNPSWWIPTLFGVQDTLLSSWVIGGLFVLMLAWIMDEGRKLREEQDLTV
jgi:hypothetical protein